MEALKQFGILVGTVVLATYTVRGIDLVIGKVGTSFKAAKATQQAAAQAALAQAAAQVAAPVAAPVNQDQAALNAVAEQLMAQDAIQQVATAAV